MKLYSGLSDVELTTLLRSGDRQSFVEIYDRYWPMLFIHARRMLRDDDEATDVIQDIFTNLWAKSSEFVLQSSLSAFLYTSTRNKAIDLINRNKLKTSYLTSLQGYYEKGEFITDDVILERELINRIEEEVQRLPKKMRAIFELSRKHHLSYKQISEITQVSEGTVKKQMHNARKILRLKLRLSVLIGVVHIVALMNKPLN